MPRDNVRRIAIATSLGPDALLLQGFTGKEGISQLYRFQVDLLSQDPALPLDKLLGQRATISIPLADGSTRYINGLIWRVTQRGRHTRYVSYRAEIVPWLQFLTLRQDCRIYQDMTVPDIITSHFKELGFFDYQVSLQGNFLKLAYCVQYQETDFHFVSRLMEQHGIFYFFEHTSEKHTMILGNSPSVHQPCPAQAQARYAHVLSEQKPMYEAMITAWQSEQKLCAGSYAIGDYNFETPDVDLTAQHASAVRQGKHTMYERFTWGTGHGDKAHGEMLVRIRAEAEEATHCVVRGESTCRAFTPGYQFALVGHYRNDLNTSYLLTSVYHKASCTEQYHSTAMIHGSYTNHFTCIPMTVPYRPAQKTPRPRIQGPQPAFVVGREGEEVFVDEYGRVTVQFLWDRRGKWNERSSCRVRVLQGLAGTGWGTMFLPRVGQEVLVEFLESDPARPVITGGLYNAMARPPMDLPEHQDCIVLLTNKRQGGGGHALLLDDRTGKMLLQSHGAMDMRSAGNARYWIGKNRHEIIQEDEVKEVKGNVYYKIKGSVIFETEESITLQAPGGFITIGPDGIYINGIKVWINSGGSRAVPPSPPLEALSVKPGAVDVLPRKMKGSSTRQ